MSSLEAARVELRARQGFGARYDAPAAPAESLVLARQGTAYLLPIANGLDDAALWTVPGASGRARRRIIAAVALEAREIAQALEEATGKQGDRAETDQAALDLAETLPAQGLRHLLARAEVHLNVTWRDLTDHEWDQPVALAKGRMAARDTPRLHAETLWRAVMDLQAGGRPRDVPAVLKGVMEEGKDR